jgi:hypothetical protein
MTVRAARFRIGAERSTSFGGPPAFPAGPAIIGRDSPSLGGEKAETAPVGSTTPVSLRPNYADRGNTVGPAQVNVPNVEEEGSRRCTRFKESWKTWAALARVKPLP